jgi:hypothetical protein
MGLESEERYRLKLLSCRSIHGDVTGPRDSRLGNPNDKCNIIKSSGCCFVLFVQRGHGQARLSPTILHNP